MPAKIPIIAGIVGTLAIGSAVAVKFIDTGVQFCDGKDCKTITQEQYAQVKTGLADKYLNGQEMTWEEYQTFVKVLDTEIKKNGGLEVRDVKSDDDIKQAAYDLLNK